MSKETGKVKRLVLSATTASIIASGVLAGAPVNAGVYLVPSDIDAYKQKTDQTFYDLYKNPTSAFRRNLPRVTGSLRRSLDRLVNVSTPNALLTFNPLVMKSAQSSVQGAPVVAGSTVYITVGGRRYQVVYDENGASIRPVNFRDFSHIKGTMIYYAGNSALNPSGSHCVSGGKYGCTRVQRVATELYFNVVTGDLVQNVVKQERTRSCSKYGCSAWGSWQTVSLLRSERSNVDIKSVALNGRYRSGSGLSLRPIRADWSIINNAGYGSKYGW